MDRLNFFNPFRHKPLEYEDVLTRAFFVLMRYEPLVLAVFLDCIREAIERAGYELPPPLTAAEQPADLYTQTGTIKSEEGRLVSVLLTDEWDGPAPKVELVDRSAVYDGVVQLGDWTFIVESKPDHTHVNVRQLCPSNSSLPPEHDLDLIPEAVCLPWNLVLVRIQGLQERSLLFGAGGLLVHDFLDLVDQDHPQLAPFKSFAICGGNLHRLRRRCDSIIGDMAEPLGGEPQDRAGRDRHVYLKNGIAQEIHLRPREQGVEGWDLQLRLWPADTVGQARRFYRNADREAFLGLQESGWEILPNLHFSFIGTHLHNVQAASIEPAPYFKAWADGELPFGRGPAEGPEYSEAVEALREHGFLSDDDVSELHRHFRDTARGHMNVIPGFSLRYGWEGENAENLDRQRKMLDMILRKVEEATSTWQ